ncbi:MAG: hypothetical protein KDC98_22540 [Planctomycetes bacterium]|nr:hypothetical protein [Planctomycetota bacterium]
MYQTFDLPTAASGSHYPMTLAGDGEQEGYLTLSATGELVLAGYGAIPNTANVAATGSAATPRVIARLHSGGIDTTTALTDRYSGESIRGATSDGQQFWTVGASGIAQAALGASTSTAIATGNGNSDCRVADIWSSQLYATTGMASQCVHTVGTGLPTTGIQTLSPLPGMAVSSPTGSPCDFYFDNGSTVYVADDRTGGGGGIQVWTLSASQWSLQTTLSPAPGVGCRGIVGYRDNIVYSLHLVATTTDNRVVRYDAFSGLFTTIHTAPPNTAFRGVRCYPIDVTMHGAGCQCSSGIPSVCATGGLPRVGNTAFAVAFDHLPPFSPMLAVIGFRPASLPLPGLPAGCALLTSVDATIFGLTGPGTATIPLPMPASPAFRGLELHVQGGFYDSTLPAPLPFATSAALGFVVQ